jgi:plastocyanin
VSAVGLLKSSGASGNISAATAGVDYQSAQSVTGIVKSSGTTRTVAVAGTDYQAPVTFTTTGSSGAATFVGNVLNIPQYISGASAFTGLSDVSSAGLTVDKIYLQAITNLTVTANGSAAYLFDQYTGDNPTVYAISGTTIAFNLGTGALSSHPFLIRTSLGANYNTGLVHVSTSGTVSTGTNAQGKTSGTLYWKIPDGITGNYQYVCQSHGSMLGVISISTSSTNPQFNSIGVGTAASTTTGEIRATNNITAYYSDDRLKTRLGPIENALDKLDSLDTFYYEANAVAQSLGYAPIKEVGLSAQQVKVIMPEVVAPAPIDDKYLTVRYERLVPLLVAAINELTAKVKALEIK